MDFSGAGDSGARPRLSDMCFLSRLLRYLEYATMGIACLAVFTMMVSVTVDAIGRYLFDQPLHGAFEFTELYLMVIVVFMGLADSFTSGTQVRLSVTERLVAAVPGRLAERAALLCVLIPFAAMTWASAEIAAGKFADQETTFGAIQFPLAWSYVWVPLGAGLTTLRLTLQVIIFPPDENAAADDVP